MCFLYVAPGSSTAANQLLRKFADANDDRFCHNVYCANCVRMSKYCFAVCLNVQVYWIVGSVTCNGTTGEHTSYSKMSCSFIIRSRYGNRLFDTRLLATFSQSPVCASFCLALSDETKKVVRQNAYDSKCPKQMRQFRWNAEKSIAIMTYSDGKWASDCVNRASTRVRHRSDGKSQRARQSAMPTRARSEAAN